jgi:hypothetical protein
MTTGRSFERHSEQFTAPPDQATPLHSGEVIECEVEGDRKDGLPMGAQSQSLIADVDRSKAAHALPAVEEQKPTSKDIRPYGSPPIAV